MQRKKINRGIINAKKSQEKRITEFIKLIWDQLYYKATKHQLKQSDVGNLDFKRDLGI